MHPPLQTVSRREAFLFWLKLGFISFGGPAGQISILHQELVERRRWISESRFLHALNYCMLLPGPEAQQLATYLGWLMHKTWGGVVAGLLFVLPSLLILMALSWVYLAFGQVPAVAGIFAGIKPVVTAIVLQAIYRMGTRTLTSPLKWGLAGASLVAMVALDLPFPAIVLVAGFVGWASSTATVTALFARSPSSAQVQPQARATNRETTVSSPASSADTDTDTDTDTDAAATPSPPHTLFDRSRLLRTCGVFALLWAVPMALLVAYAGWDQTLAQMGWFFTKVALLTFGGAYAVLPYVLDGAVHHYGWLSAGQMIDGLALGETTPGPLIMVVAFVGFLGGHQHAVLGPDHLWVGAMLAASVVTWFTFLPSFFFILAGGPLVERSHGNLALTATLGAVTAAVIGAMLQMGVFFGSQVLWPAGQWDPQATALMLAAVWALLRWKRSVMEVIGAGALMGLLLALV